MHLGHVLTSDLDDKAEILHKRNSVCAKVNSVLCHFYKCAPLVKLKLLRSYCSDFYGSMLWNLSDSSIEEVCVAWRKGLRRALGLPWRTHSVLLAPITGMLPLRDELFCNLFYTVLQVITVLLTMWLSMVFILEGCTRQLVSTPSFAVNITMCHCTALAALTESLGILSSGI